MPANNSQVMIWLLFAVVVKEEKMKPYQLDRNNAKLFSEY
ncbi:hypothetical protein RINTHH_19680 [Richelia intracellularis HH01]|uniref:Uncharacterized protein n=1 Tax=Richelia intracellularis HH01 TaxID=1165094 RepID=M1X1E5_9NOST|nr:hypothetical protein RINTHH_19680 [Richelia intracellularis HH01]